MIISIQIRHSKSQSKSLFVFIMSHIISKYLWYFGGFCCLKLLLKWSHHYFMTCNVIISQFSMLMKMSLCVQWKESMGICLFPSLKLGMSSEAKLFRDFTARDQKGVHALKHTEDIYRIYFKEGSLLMKNLELGVSMLLADFKILIILCWCSYISGKC